MIFEESSTDKIWPIMSKTCQELQSNEKRYFVETGKTTTAIIHNWTLILAMFDFYKTLNRTKIENQYIPVMTDKYLTLIWTAPADKE